MNNANEGIELRDYFAAKAINGLISSDITEEKLALCAYEVADAMMEVRKKNKQSKKKNERPIKTTKRNGSAPRGGD